MLDRKLLMLDPTYRYCFNKGREEGFEEGKKEVEIEVAKNMLNEGYPMRAIVRITGLSKSDILNLH